jgi:hypothetical protein
MPRPKRKTSIAAKDDREGCPAADRGNSPGGLLLGGREDSQGQRMQKHPTKHVIYKDQEADIDVDIAVLVLNLWKLGIHTVNSCQDNVPKGFVWIEFLSTFDAEQFLDSVADYYDEPDSLYQRMKRDWGDETPMDWQYSPFLRDYGVDLVPVGDREGYTTFNGSHQFNFSMSVRFPREDLEFVKARIRKAAS